MSVSADGLIRPILTASKIALRIVVLSSCVATAEEIEWRFRGDGDVESHHNFTYSRTAHDTFGGPVQWDPYVYLRLPAGGIDAAKLHYLEVRLYSSAPADLLDIYYQAPNGDWALMGAHPVKKGWATYRMDLATMPAHESGSSSMSGRWGGAPRRVMALRIDPGNQADRWVMMGRIRLTDRPLAPGIAEEPRGQASIAVVKAPDKIAAGDTIDVSLAMRRRSVPPELNSCMTHVRLMRGATVLGIREQRMDLRQSEQALTASFPTSQYLSTGRLTIQAGAYELDAPPGAAPAGDLAVIHVHNPRQGHVRPPQVDVRRLAGDPTIHVDGKPMVGMTFLTGTVGSAALHEEFARAGIHLFTDWFGSSGAGNLGHVAEGKYDYGEFDAYFSRILDADPEAIFIPHLYVTPPAWWQQKNAAEQCVYSDGGRVCQSFASLKWRREIGDDLRRLIEHLRSTSYADRILGYILCSGHSAEWQEWGIWDEHWADYSDPSRQAFRAWLRERYATDAALQAAWRDPKVTFAAAELPTVGERKTATAYVLRDPTKEQRVIDFYQYLSETMAGAILHFARIAKQTSGGRSLVGAYYGYLTQHWIHQQDSAHLALAKVLESPDIDFLMSPPMYTGREVGGTSTFMSAVNSVKLHGKLWLNESDIRTHKSAPDAGYGRAATLPQSLALLRREFGEMLARRTAISWFDMDSGWFSDPDILADMARMRRLADDAMTHRQPFQAEMAVFISTESAFRMKPSELWLPAVLQQVVDLPRVGTPADIHLLSDIRRPDFPRYKVYVFLNAFYVDAETRRVLNEKVKNRGAVTVWVFAPGAITDAGLSTESMRELTGIRIAMELKEAPLQVRPRTDTDLCRGLPADQPIGWAEKNGPVFSSEDPEAEVLGHLTANARPGLVRKEIGDWTSIFYATVGMPPTLLRNIARSAGIHVYLDTNDAIDTDGQWACIHAKASGTKTLRLPGPRRIVDAFSEKVLSEKAAEITISMNVGQTVLVRLEAP